MHKRHKDRAAYFKEMSITSKEYFIPYIRPWHAIEAGVNILEIGCGDGGNLLPFSKMGCHTVGGDVSSRRIEDAKIYFETTHAKGVFIAENIFNFRNLEFDFDIIICPDVLEHIPGKVQFLSILGKYLKPNGIVFISFPAWQMPFGGHQQICRNRILSHLPFIHLLPNSLYHTTLKAFEETIGRVDELLLIKQTGITIEHFENLLKGTTFNIQDRQLWFFNPHYKIKFGLPPIKLHPVFSSIPYLRNYLSTSCFYILRNMKRQTATAHDSLKK